MNALARIDDDASNIAALLAIVPDQAPAIYAWATDLQRVADAPRSKRQAMLSQIAEERGIPSKTVAKKLTAYRQSGVAGLIDRTTVPALWETSKTDIGLSESDRELIKTWCETFQRKCEPALEAMLRSWRTQTLSAELLDRGLTVPETSTPLDPTTGYPRGWSLRNLMRYAPTQYELKAARIGRSAAKEHAPLVYTTRKNYYVGQFYVWDDIWHDQEVVDLDQKKRGRPLEFHGLDLASACKFTWGSRTRVETEFKHEGLKSSDFRFVLTAGLTGIGYHSTRGTTLLVEKATASIPEEVRRMLFDATNGMIRVADGGMEGAAAHGGQWAGRSKGNFRFKAALESLGNLIHNELAYLPAQVGMDRDHCPEEMNDGGRLIDPSTGKALTSFGRNKYTDSLLAAFSELMETAPERAQWIEWDRCTIQQFRLVCEEVYARINRRTKHDLEGWDERYVPDPLGGMRRMSPHEVFAPGRRALKPISIETTALLLGTSGGVERTVIGNKIAVHDGSISGDELRFNAVGVLPDREKFLTVVNPFDPSRLFCFDSKDRFVAVLPRIVSVDRSDIEAVHRAMGAAARNETQLLAPLVRRHNAKARLRAAKSAHNAAVLGNDTPADHAERERLADEAAPISDFIDPAPAESPAPLKPSDFL